jgi:hypothetical protein
MAGVKFFRNMILPERCARCELPVDNPFPKYSGYALCDGLGHDIP